MISRRPRTFWMVVVEMWWSRAMSRRLRPSSRRFRIAISSSSRVWRPMWRPSSLARLMPARTRSSQVAIQLGDRPDSVSGSSRIEAHLRELRSVRLGLLRISIP